MILLIGSTGYIGSQFVFELTQRQIDFVSIGRDSTSSYDLLLKNILDNKVEFVINAAGYVGKEDPRDPLTCRAGFFSSCG